MDPAACAGCHAEAYNAWSTSMHAHAADDPLFVAMNARAQRETGGAVGGFCVGCHAPLALRTLATTDGRNLASLPAKLRGVTCFFCHSVQDVAEAHDDGLTLASDGAMRGPIKDPAPGAPHGSRYSALHDRDALASASLCGACHDVRLPGGLDVERTFAEWSTTVFAHTGAGQKTCGDCHMVQTTGFAADVPAAPRRPIHDHAMVGIDVPLGVPIQPGATHAVQSRLDPALDAQLCVPAAGLADITLTNSRIGHAWPTGAAHDRRAWVELVAYAGDSVVYASGGPAASGTQAQTSTLSLEETLFGRDHQPVPFLWEASSTRSVVLPPTTTVDPDAPGFEHGVTTHYAIPPSADRVTMRVLVTPVAPGVVAALIASGDLAPLIADRIPTYTLAGTSLEWDKDRGWACLP